MQISVVIPAYNEEKVIAKTVDQVKGFLKNNFSNFEIIVVDDKSTDSTLSIIQNIADIEILRNMVNHGKGYSVTKGVKAAKGDLILFMDADGSTNISELERFIKYNDGDTLIIASRALPDSDIQVRQNKIKVFLGRAGNLLSRIMIAPDIYDTQCGFKLFPSKMKILFNKMTIENFGFDYELIFLARKYNFKIKEVPVVWCNNFDSKVKWHTYITTFIQLFKIRLYNLLGRY